MNKYKLEQCRCAQNCRRVRIESNDIGAEGFFYSNATDEAKKAVRALNSFDDLLEALERLVANVDGGEFVSATQISEAHAAIKKAKGEA